MGREKIFTIVGREKPGDPFRKIQESVESFKGLSFEEVDQRIAEEAFNDPVILFKILAIRRFCRDGKKPPSLKGNNAISSRWTLGH